MEAIITPKRVIDSPQQSLFGKRRSLVTSTPAILEVNDDESERLHHRRSVIEQTKLNTSLEKNSILSASKALPSDQLEKLLETCLRMSAENKITARNVWQIHVIQYLGQLYNKPTNNNLQVASAGLDVSAKVYGLRVDSVYTNAIKIAGDLSRQSGEGKKNRGANEENNDETLQEDGENLENVDPDQRRKKKAKRSKKTVISNNPSNLTAEPDVVETMEPILVQLTAKGCDINSSECLFQANLNIHEKQSELCVLSEQPYFDFRTSEDINSTINTQLKTELPNMPSIVNDKICVEFADFLLTDWSPEHEELRLLQEERANDYAFDMNVTPLPIEEPTNHIGAGFDGNNYSSDDEVVEGIVENQIALKRRVEQIVDMRPTSTAAVSDLEYSYNPIVSGIWAGPAHWKIKSNILKSAAPANTADKEKVNMQKKKVKKVPKKFDFSRLTVVDFGCSNKKITKLKRATIQSWLASKHTLPTDLHIEIADKLTLSLNPSIKFTLAQGPKSPEINVEESIPQYDYNNPNDSNFCIGTAADSDPENEADGCNDIPQDCEMDEPFTGDNLISAPTMVPKNFIHYALRAKRMDMKKLKAAVSKVVNDSKSSKGKENNQIEITEEKFSIKFSELHKTVPKLLSNEMKDNLSCGLEFLALLHVANEENLNLIWEDLTDFTITK